MDMTGVTARKVWALDEKAWTLFLRRLHEDSETAGKLYEELRSRLMTVFRCRGLLDPTSLADEAIDRTIKGMEKEEIRDIFAYAITVARYIASEAHRRPTPMALSDIQEPQQPENSEASQENERAEQWLCLEHCTECLSPSDRDLVLGWYQHEKSEKAEEKRRLAATLGIAIGALRVRAYRVRERIRLCVSDCMSKKRRNVS